MILKEINYPRYERDKNCTKLTKTSTFSFIIILFWYFGFVILLKGTRKLTQHPQMSKKAQSYSEVKL